MSQRQFGPLGVRARANLRDLVTPTDLEVFKRRLNTDGPIMRAGLGPCHVYTGPLDRYGYGRIWIGPSGGRVIALVHRLALELAVGPIVGLALHKCDNRACGNAAHLFEGDHARNIADREERGRHAHASPPPHPLGEAHPRAVLTTEKVIEIRLRAARGEAQVAIASAFGLDPRHVHRIVTRQLWRHVDVPMDMPS